jgi:hypothetical protein
MKVWFDDPRQLVDEKQFLQFWPNSKQTPEERINAASRFIVYTSALLYVIRRDPRVFVLGLTILGVMYVLYKSKMVKETYAASPMGESMCQKPTVDNPMANVLMTDYGGAPNRLEACYYPSVKPYVQRYSSDRIPYDSGRSRTSMPQYLRNAMDRRKSQEDKQSSRSGCTARRTVRCARAIPSSAARTPGAPSLRRFPGSVWKVTEDR